MWGVSSRVSVGGGREGQGGNIAHFINACSGEKEHIRPFYKEIETLNGPRCNTQRGERRLVAVWLTSRVAGVT